jgi:predicted transcriptional regulator
VCCGFNRRFHPGIAGRKNTEEVSHTNGLHTHHHPTGGRLVPKTLAIKLEDDTHAQLTILAQLEGMPVSDALKQAVDGYITSKRSQPELKARLESVLADIERDATTRREAITSLFSDGEPAESDAGTTADAKASPRKARDKGGESATS